MAGFLDQLAEKAKGAVRRGIEIERANQNKPKKKKRKARTQKQENKGLGGRGFIKRSQSRKAKRLGEVLGEIKSTRG